MSRFEQILVETFQYKSKNKYDNIIKSQNVTSNYEVQSHETHVTELQHQKEYSELKSIKFTENVIKALAKSLNPKIINEDIKVLSNVVFPKKRLSWEDFDKEHGIGALKASSIHNADDVTKLTKFFLKDPRLTFDHTKLHEDHVDIIKNFERLTAKMSPLNEYTSTQLRPDGKKSIIKFLPSIHGKSRAHLRVNQYSTDDWNGLLDDVNKHFAKTPKMLAHAGSWLVHSKSRNVTIAVQGNYRKDGVVHMSIPTVLSPGMSYEEESKKLYPTSPIILD